MAPVPEAEMGSQLCDLAPPDDRVLASSVLLLIAVTRGRLESDSATNQIAVALFLLLLLLSLPFWWIGAYGGRLPFATFLPVSALMTFIPMIAALALVYRRAARKVHARFWRERRILAGSRALDGHSRRAKAPRPHSGGSQSQARPSTPQPAEGVALPAYDPMVTFLILRYRRDSSCPVGTGLGTGAQIPANTPRVKVP